MIKKIIGIILSFVISSVIPSVGTIVSYAAETSTVPSVVYIPWKLEPGEIGAVYGEDFDSESTVAIQPLTGYSGEASANNAKYKVKPINTNSQYLQFEMPSDIAYDVCAVWVSNKNGWSDVVYTNKPVMYWVNEHNVYSGQKLLLYVRNAVNPTNRSASGATVEFVEQGTGNVLTASVYDITDYQVYFTAPTGLKVGSKYDIRYTNGAGGEYGWSQMESVERETVTAVENDTNTKYFDKNWDLNISWFSTVNTANMLNVRDFGAKGDGTTNDTAAIQAAVDKAKSDGGGVVYIPNGTYIVDFVNIGGDTILRGESQDKTILKWSGKSDKNVLETPRTTINRAAASGEKYKEACKLIYTDESHVGLFDLSIINDIQRPEKYYSSDTNINRFIYGYLVPVAFLGRSQQWGDDNFTDGEEGYEAENYVLKNVTINNADGAGVMLWTEKAYIVEDCDIYITHSNELRYGDYSRVKNNKISNFMRPMLCFMATSDCIWMEGNVLTGRDDTRRMQEGELEQLQWGEIWTSIEHRGTDFGGEEYLFVDNTFLGEIGNDTEGSGEGFQSQDGASHLYTGVKDAGENWVTGNSSAESVVAGDELVITSGRGLGQHMKVKEVSGEKIILEQNWKVIPDKTSIMQVYVTLQSGVTFYDNKWECNNNKGSIHLYRSGYDVAIVDNYLPDGGGIRMAAMHRANCVDIQYFNLVENNYIAGSTNIRHAHQGASTAIGPSNDMGMHTSNFRLQDKTLLSTLQYGVRILHNDMTGLGTSTKDEIFRVTGPLLDQTRPDEIESEYGSAISQFIAYNGIVISTNRERDVQRGDIPSKASVSHIVDGNRVTDSIAGIHSSSNTYDAIIRNNDLSGNGKEISEEGTSHNTMMLNTSDGKKPGLIERAEINKSMLKKVSQNNDLSGLDFSGTNDEKVEDNVLVFSDIENHWAKNYITYLKNNEVVDGVTEDLFEPDRTVTRAEFITMLTKACGMNINGFRGGYYDVYTSDWYAPYMQAAKDASLLDDNMLQYNKAFPNNILTREQAASITARAMQSMGYEQNVKIKLEVYDDADSIDEWAKPYIGYLYEKLVMQGTELHRFTPKAAITRAEAATIIYNMLAHM